MLLLGLGACGKSTSTSGDGGSRGDDAGAGAGGASRGGTGGSANMGGSGGSTDGNGQGGSGGGGRSGGTGGTAGAGAGGSGGNTGSGGAPTGGSGGGGRSGGNGGSGGNAGSGGGGRAGAGGSGRAGSGGSAASGGSIGSGGAAGRAGGGGSGGKSVDAGRDAPETGAFACNLIIGNSTTQQWFDGGFLTHAGIDATHWEMYFVAHHYIDSWANPTDTGWTTALDMGHACASDSTTPDRVIFIVTFSPPYPPEATYQSDLNSIVNNIKAKYPSAKRVELMTLIRAPGNSDTACSSKANNEQSIPPAEDAGIAAVAADPTFAGLVVALPPAYVTSCSDFITDEPQYTTAGATNIAGVYGAYYAAHP